jgi:hypothetical protein
LSLLPSHPSVLHHHGHRHVITQTRLFFTLSISGNNCKALFGLYFNPIFLYFTQYLKALGGDAYFRPAFPITQKKNDHERSSFNTGHHKRFYHRRDSC